MGQLSAQLRRLIFSGNCYRQSRDSVSAESVGTLSSVWVMSRALCSFHRCDFSHVSQDKRDAALKNRLLLESPYNDPAYWAIWQNGRASAWTWDRVAAEQKMSEHLIADDSIALVNSLPESALAPDCESGLQMYRSMDGCVIQFWEQGELVAERLFNDVPTDNERKLFLRSNGRQPAPNEVREVSLAEHYEKTAGWDIRELRYHEPLLVGLAAIVLSAALAFQMVSWGGLWMLTSYERARSEESRLALEPVLALRQQVLDMRDKNRLLETIPSNSQLETMWQVMSALPGGEGRSGALQEWHSNADSLVITVHQPTASLESYAEALDQLELFGSVELKPNDRAGHLEIEMVAKP